MAEPTTSEYLNAANWTYTRDPNVMPADLKPFTVNGQQVTQQITDDGFYGAAFISPAGQVIVAFEGTSPSSLDTDPAFGTAQLLADAQIYLGQNPAVYGDAAAFTQTVLADAAEQGINADNVRITGHSLGAAEVEYVSATMGMSGDAFAPPGIPQSDIVPGKGGTLTDYVEYGDPVANYAADSHVLGHFLYSQSIVHYGTVKDIGPRYPAETLRLAGELFGQSNWATAAALGLLAANAAEYHLATRYAHDLGIHLTNPDVLLDANVALAFKDIQQDVLRFEHGAGTEPGSTGLLGAPAPAHHAVSAAPAQNWLGELAGLLPVAAHPAANAAPAHSGGQPAEFGAATGLFGAVLQAMDHGVSGGLGHTA